MDTTNNAATETITLGGGCFWCIETIFADLRGVAAVRSGYAGGKVRNPTYREVCSGLTGHAEVIEVVFDPTVITARQILEVFFTIHDPTTLNRQGADVGTQYRSVVFYHTEAQHEATREVIAATVAAGIWTDPIVTEVLPAPAFYVAEDYHQDYYNLHGTEPYCSAVIAPKVAKFRSKYKTLRKDYVAES